jgi:hypothetical protein
MVLDVQISDATERAVTQVVSMHREMMGLQKQLSVHHQRQLVCQK